jgi:hypothetical protein
LIVKVLGTAPPDLGFDYLINRNLRCTPYHSSGLGRPGT